MLKTTAKFILLGRDTEKTMPSRPSAEKDRKLQERRGLSAKKYMSDLEEQVRKSKLAADNIVSFGSTEVALRKQINKVRDELYRSITSINSEAKRNEVLKELIALLKGQIASADQVKKQEEELRYEKNEKKIHKLEYDIEQILQKDNEQIAKINRLKQQTDCSRSERVVFSNLFKKLEKEIKHYQLIYQQELLRTQLMDSQKTSNERKAAERAEADKIFEEEQGKNWDGSLENASDCSGVIPSEIQKEEKRYRNKPIEKLGKTIRAAVSHHKDISKQIFETDSCIEQLLVLGGCASVKEMLEHYSRLEEKNAAMVAQIAEDNLKIEKLEAKIDQLKKFMLNSFTEERDVNENTHLRDYEVTKNGLFNEQEIEAEDMAIIRKLADELHIPHEKENSYNLLLSIAERISAFERKIEGSRVKGTKTTEDGEQVEQLLERMDRFQESERLLDKTSFQQEYFRELCKSKRHQRSRK